MGRIEIDKEIRLGETGILLNPETKWSKKRDLNIDSDNAPLLVGWKDQVDQTVPAKIHYFDHQFK